MRVSKFTKSIKIISRSYYYLILSLHNTDLYELSEADIGRSGLWSKNLETKLRAWRYKTSNSRSSMAKPSIVIVEKRGESGVQ